MERYGITGIPLSFFRSYLSDQYQYTRINGVDSARLKITCGVPQGSILGPLLFIIYINDLSQISSFSVGLYADDTCLIISHRDISHLVMNCNEQLKMIGS